MSDLRSEADYVDAINDLRRSLIVLQDDQLAEKWLARVRWSGNVKCVACGSKKVSVYETRRNPTPLYGCRDCGARFNVKSGTVLRGSALPAWKWAMAFHLCSEMFKQVGTDHLSSYLHTNRNTGLRVAWRIREAWDKANALPSYENEFRNATPDVARSKDIPMSRRPIPMPPTIPASPEHIASLVMNAEPEDEWVYEKRWPVLLPGQKGYTLAGARN